MAFGKPAAAAQGERWKIPLHVVTSVGTIALLVIVASVLAWHAYNGTRKVLLSSVDESITHVSRVLRDRIDSILQPAENQIDLLANYDIARAHTPEQRLAALPVMRSAIASNPLLDAIYAGYPNGEFILFRPLRTPALKQMFRAPQQAELLVQTQTAQADGRNAGEYRYYDSKGQLLQLEARNDYVYDPRIRPWYISAVASAQSVMVEPYIFSTTRAIGSSLALRTSEPGVVVGLDVTLASLTHEIAALRVTPGTRIVVVDSGNYVVTSDNGPRDIVVDASGKPIPQKVEAIETPALGAAAGLPVRDIQRQHQRIQGSDWELVSMPITLRAHGKALRLLMAVPHAELFREARTLLRRQLMLTLLLILASAPAGYWLTQQLAKPLRSLAHDTRSVSSFDFASSNVRRSRIAEVDMLATATMQMKSTISRFIDVSAALNSETSLERLLEVVLGDVIATTHARSGALYLYDPDTKTLVRSQEQLTAAAHASHAETLSAASHPSHPATQLVANRRSIVGVAEADGPQLVAVALETLGKDFVGAIVLELPQSLAAVQAGGRNPQLAFIEALSSTAAVAIETRHLVDSQKNLLESLIQLLAGAIDAKSPYTGGHCQRVPALTKMLVHAAEDATDGPFSDFQLNADEWEAVHVGAWLHDCGKVTTPEYVVDKATKLEGIFNRIHEIRTRFEVLKRDAEIAYWRNRSQGTPEQEAWAELQARWKALDEDFAFIADCNVGGEFLDPAKIERIKTIAQRPWMRTLDDRLGLSREEARPLQGIPPQALPHVETLLADKPEHLIPRPAEEQATASKDARFQIKVPKYKFNRGEIYNLAISRGTLTEEERFIINDHIVQTIVMLERLPFPRHLRSVPEIAGGHHERMDGRGYPMGLKREDMSVPARIMAIADVFEALTAADRPYKLPKTLSESLGIMARMTRENHLDADLFELFLRSGIYRQYAEQFLLASQIDEVDIEALLRVG
ncbi:HD domain-containing phosphohydrolase [Uliginosibacterium sp. H3]|uniref:HD domain-containing phosphohydrolase n=1 Tax=Uliginosibacterium silvisoli TaxID=3114758 RepID=A0ABU6JZ39_9RHOO|nr:HD domain-containing phosphohydrolase [Uliginosibacterium sp. H3]